MERDRREDFINWVNQTFKPSDARHAAAVRLRDGSYILTGEVSAIDRAKALTVGFPIVSIVGEYGDGEPWIHPRVVEMARELGLDLVWEGPAKVTIYTRNGLP